MRPIPFAVPLGLALACGDSAGAPLVVDRVELSSQSVIVGPANTLQLTAVPRTASGQEVPGRTISWSIGSPAVATVSGSGLVTGVAFGATVVAATVDGKSAMAEVNVVPTTASHLAANWKMDSFDNKTVPAAYALFYNEPVDDRIIGVVEIRLDSARKSISTAGIYQRTYFFSEYHDGVKVLSYLWGDHGQLNVGTGLPVPVSMFSNFIQNLTTAGHVSPDVKLVLSEELWVGEAKHATIWSRR
jgi:hypothetical protein